MTNIKRIANDVTTGAALFTRDGNEYTGKLVTNDKGQRGFWTYSPCSRCGGAGGYAGWPGYKCFRCNDAANSRTFEADFSRVYTADQLVKLNAAADKRAAKKAAKLDAIDAAKRAEVEARRVSFNAAHGTLLVRAEAVATSNTFIADIVSKARENARLSDAQIAALTTAVERAEKRSADVNASEFFGTIGDRIKNIPVEVTNVASFERTAFHSYRGVWRLSTSSP